MNKNLRPRLGMAVTPLLAVWPGLAMAQAEFHPYAASQYEFDSNVFSLPNRDQAILLTGDAARDDTDWRSVAGLDAAYAWDRGRDRLGVTAEGRRLLYDRFSQLDHNEYLASGQFDWKAGTAWDGTLGARQERRMASFATRTGTTERDMELDHNANAGVNVNLDPEWRVETAATWHKLDSPLPGFPDFQLRESGGTAALKYLGVSHLTAGVEAGYTDGRFSGVPDAPAYTQLTAGLTMSYALSGITTVDSDVGYTRFKDRGTGGENVNGLSGSLQLTEHISVKTNVHLRAFRRVNSYVAGANAVIDSGTEAGFDWHPTGKIGVAAGYQWIYSEYRALGPVAAVDSDRRDHYQAVTLELTYAMLDWASWRLYGSYFDRSSTLLIDEYNQALAGVELRLRLP
ncbi:MAG TPA: hypothetical protein VFA75_06020 [Nevskia sp.]|nr:hypothetical protein [Nevskia sp.]